LSLILVDVHHFKHYNDFYGQQKGDRLTLYQDCSFYRIPLLYNLQDIFTGNKRPSSCRVAQRSKFE